MKTDKESIEALGLTNPIVKQFLAYHHHCRATWEVALIHMVHALANQNNQLTADVLRIRLHGLPPTVIVTSQEQADQIRATYQMRPLAESIDELASTNPVPCSHAINLPAESKQS